MLSLTNLSLLGVCLVRANDTGVAIPRCNYSVTKGCLNQAIDISSVYKGGVY